MLLKISATTDFVKDLPIWQQLVCCPEKIKLLSETQLENEMVILPDTLVEKSVGELKTILLEIINTRFTGKNRLELISVLNLVQEAHNSTGEKRDSGQPQFQHVLIATLLSWTYSFAFLPKKSINEKELLLVMLHHDSIEDTKIYSSDKGQQFEEIINRHGINIGIGVGYFTRTHVKVNKHEPRFEEFRQLQLKTHFSAFKDDSCPKKYRLWKACDRLANFSDYTYSHYDFFQRKFKETILYFDKFILFDLPKKFQALFWGYLYAQYDKFGGIF